MEIAVNGKTAHKGPVTITPNGLEKRALGASLESLLECPVQLEIRIRKELQKFMHHVEGRSAPVLLFEDVAGLTDMLALELQVDPEIFGEMNQMFWRFDFGGDGMLDEAEALLMCCSMLRCYRDATRPPAPGCVRLGKSIAYRNLHEKVDIERKLGQGGQGSVFLCQAKGEVLTTSKQVVVKMYDKSNPSAPLEEITKEFELLTSLKHPRIARVFDIFQDLANVYVVQEPYLGGDLTDAVRKAAEAGVLVNEPWLARVIKQVLAGVAFLHENFVMHCDLKEANVMLKDATDLRDPQIVVIDFGLSNRFTTRSRPGGTPGYMPPEVWDTGLWTPKGDVFSMGVMIFSMRTGTPPFTEGCATLEDVQRETRERVPQMAVGSCAVKTLVRAMIEKDFCHRGSVAQVLQHSWFSGAADAGQAVNTDVLSLLSKRRQKTDLRRALLADLAANENLAQMKELNGIFLELDTDNDGTITADEVRAGLRGNPSWPDKRIEQLISVLMGDEDTAVAYEEFMGQLIAAKEPEENELLARIFSEADRQKKGYLDVGDVEALLTRPAVARILAGRQPATLLREMDADADGRVSFEEFRLAMQGRAGWRPGAHRLIMMSPSTWGWQVGTELEYYSTTYGEWISCCITAMDSQTGALQIDVKPGYWFRPGPEMRTRLRRPRGGIFAFISSLNPLTWGKRTGFCCR